MNGTGNMDIICAVVVPPSGTADKPISISEREMLALNALAGSYGGDFDCLNFKAIARRGKLDPKHVRRSVRALARKGLAEYAKGLWTEDGDPAGSGYRCTPAGRAAATNPFEPEWY